MSKMVRKVFASQVRAVDTDRKTVETVMSDETLDRYDEIIEVQAYKKTLKSFMKHPILLSSHSYEDLRAQIGEWLKVWIDGKSLVGLAKYYVGEGNPEADWGFKLAEKGIAAFSVGFIDIKSERATWEEYSAAKEAGKKIPWRVYKEVELLETSQVVVPANPAAIQRSLENEADSNHQLALKMKDAFRDDEFEQFLRGTSADKIATRFLIDLHLPDEIDHIDEPNAGGTEVKTVTATAEPVKEEEKTVTEVVAAAGTEVHKEAELNEEGVTMNDEQLKKLSDSIVEALKGICAGLADTVGQVTKKIDELTANVNLKNVLPDTTYVESIGDDSVAKEGATSADDIATLMKSLDGVGDRINTAKKVDTTGEQT